MIQTNPSPSAAQLESWRKLWQILLSKPASEAQPGARREGGA